MKRICLFAGYDKDGIIDDYVLHYIKELNKISDVYYFGDFYGVEEELNKLNKYCKGVYSKRHKKYDFGSWDELVKLIGIEKIRKYDELILANDSCFGPLKSLEPIFQTMEKKDCDFWGLSCSRGYHIHIQSYFVVFNKNVIQSDCLFDFLDKVVPEESLQMVCNKYEDRLAYILSKEGFKFESYIPYGEFKMHPYFNSWSCISNDKVNFPFIKVKMFNGNVGNEPQKDWVNFIKNNTNYDYNLILNNLKRRGLTNNDIKKNVYYNKINKSIRKLNIKHLIIKLIRLFTYPIRKKMHSFVDSKLSYYSNAVNNRLNELEQKLFELQKKSMLTKQDIKRGFKIDSKGKRKTLFNHNDTFRIHEPNNIFIKYNNEIKNILFIGDFCIQNKALFEFSNNNCFFIDEKIDETTMSIKKQDKNIKFDLIIIQNILSIEKLLIIENILKNLKNYAIPETTFVLSINKDSKIIKQYKKIFKKLNFVNDFDAKKMFNNKITTINQYQEFFIRLK